MERKLDDDLQLVTALIYATLVTQHQQGVGHQKTEQAVLYGTKIIEAIGDAENGVKVRALFAVLLGLAVNAPITVLPPMPERTQ